MLNVEVVTTTEGFQALEKEWNQLLAKSAADTIFLTWEWLYTWWEVYGDNKQLHLVLVRYERDLLGIAPFYREEVRHYGFLTLREVYFLGEGEVCSDYRNFIICRHREFEVLSTIFDSLMNEFPSWDVMRFMNLPQGSTEHKILTQIFSERAVPFQCRPLTVCPYLPLNGGWESYLKSLSRSSRREIRRDRKRLETRGDIRFHRHTDSQTLDQAFDQFIAFHQSRWMERGLHGHFTSSLYSSFHRKLIHRMLAREWLYFVFLTVDGVPVSYQYGLQYKGKIYAYLPAYDVNWAPYSVGMVLLSHCLEEAFKDGVEEFDFLQGDEEFKARWTDKIRNGIALELYQQSPRTGLYWGLHSTETRLRSGAKRCLPQPVLGELRRWRRNKRLRRESKQGNVH